MKEVCNGKPTLMCQTWLHQRIEILIRRQLFGFPFLFPYFSPLILQAPGIYSLSQALSCPL